MTLRKGFARLGVAVALLAIVTSIGLLAGSTTSHAQPVPPFLAYGVGATAGDTVAATVDGTDCGSTTVDADGQWTIQISPTAPCVVAAGDTINFTLNGAAVTETATYSSGGSVAGAYPAATGVPLTVDTAAAEAAAEAEAAAAAEAEAAAAAEAEAAAAAEAEAAAAAAAAAAPAPADTGNAGLATEAGTTLWFALALGALALATLAGARVSTGREQR